MVNLSCSTCMWTPERDHTLIPYSIGFYLGSRYSETYVWKDVTIGIDFQITSVCSKNDEDCEGTDLDATLTAKRGAQVQTLSLAGYSGC